MVVWVLPGQSMKYHVFSSKIVSSGPVAVPRVHKPIPVFELSASQPHPGSLWHSPQVLCSLQTLDSEIACSFNIKSNDIPAWHTLSNRFPDPDVTQEWHCPYANESVYASRLIHLFVLGHHMHWSNSTHLLQFSRWAHGRGHSELFRNNVRLKEGKWEGEINLFLSWRTDFVSYS